MLAFLLRFICNCKVLISLKTFNMLMLFMTIARAIQHLQHFVIIYYKSQANAYYSVRIIHIGHAQDINLNGHYLWLEGRSQHEIIIKCDIFHNLDDEKKKLRAYFLLANREAYDINSCNSRHLTWKITLHFIFICIHFD